MDDISIYGDARARRFNNAFPTVPYWINVNSEIILISDMTTDYIENCINYLKRIMNESFKNMIDADHTTRKVLVSLTKSRVNKILELKAEMIRRDINNPAHITF